MTNLINMLGCGAENAMSREYLASMLQTSDRHIRRMVQEAREKGVPIISSSHVTGYFLPKSEAELVRFKREQQSRILKILQGIEGLEWEVPCLTES